MQSQSRPKSFRAHQLINNFSRKLHTEKPLNQDFEFTLKLKSRKPAFTSRIMHPLKKVDLKEIKIATESYNAPFCSRTNKLSKFPDNPFKISQFSGTKKGNPNCLKAQEEVFSFRSTGKKRVLTPKVLKINVNGPKNKLRSFSAYTPGRNRSSQPNPQVFGRPMQFQFTFGINERIF